MKEIKIRAWNKKENCWANLNQLSDWGSAEMTGCIGMGNEKYPYQTFELKSDNIYELMQFTGQLDKNGKEIFENDIAKIKVVICGLLVEYFGVMKFINGQFLFEYEAELSPENEIVETPEVVGNIYENKDLLE